MNASDDSSDGNISEESTSKFGNIYNQDVWGGGESKYSNTKSGAVCVSVFPPLPGAGYEWEDDFPLLPLATSSELSDSPPPRSTPKAPDPKPAAHFSRFTVCPSSTSRFSITHISDSDMDSVGGGSPSLASQLLQFFVRSFFFTSVSK